MSSITEWVLTNVVSYGAPILFLVSYVGSLGIPFPISAIVVAAGAFSRLGFIDWRVALIACLFGSILADNTEYYLGMRATLALERRFSNGFIWKQGLRTFNRQGGWAILLTRFWLTSLAPVVNLIAGGRYPYKRFLLFDITGEMLWVILYGGLGYIAGGEWEVVSQFLSDFTGLSLGLVVLAVAVYFIVRQVRKGK